MVPLVFKTSLGTVRPSEGSTPSLLRQGTPARLGHPTMRCDHRKVENVAVVALVCLVWVSIALPSSAQTLDRGEIIGTVRDQSGAVMPGVTVTMQEIDTGFERSAVTNHAGQYNGVLLPVG